MTPPGNNPWLYLVGLLFTFLSGIGLKDIIVGLVKRKPRQAVEVTNQIDLAAAARAYSQEIEEDARQARQSAQDAWRLVDEANQKLVRITRKLDDSTYKLEQAGRYLDTVMSKLFERGATIEGMREWVRSQPPPSINGHHGNGREGH